MLNTISLCMLILHFKWFHLHEQTYRIQSFGDCADLLLVDDRQEYINGIDSDLTSLDFFIGDISTPMCMQQYLEISMISDS